MAPKIPSSPFQAGTVLWGAASSPPGTTCTSLDFLLPSKVASEGFRADYLSPEAVQGFTLQAYRPASLPVKQADPMDEDSSSEASSMDLEYQLSVICKDLQSLAEEEEEEDVALSLTSSPQLQRTDRPITRFLPPKDVSAIRRASTDGRVQGLSERRSLELCYRSHSAPGFMGALRVDDMWASVPKPAAVNPFDNVLDMDGLFSA